MGAGQYKAGLDGGAGRTLAADTEAATRPGYPHALAFMLQDRDYAIGENGRYLETHPVDERVNFKLGVSRGSIAGDPTIGHRFREIVNLRGPRLLAEVRDAVQLALATELSNGDIRILNIEAEAQGFGGLLIAVEYVNLRTAPPDRLVGEQRGQRVAIEVLG